MGEGRYRGFATIGEWRGDMEERINGKNRTHKTKKIKKKEEKKTRKEKEKKERNERGWQKERKNVMDAPGRL